MEREIDRRLLKKLSKLSRRNPVLYEAVLKKVDEILDKPSSHYKNLRKPLQHLKRVHVTKSFVLVFQSKSNKIIFHDLDHHDNIY